MNFKHLVSIILVFAMSFGMCSVAFASDEIPEGYMPIYTAKDLNNIRNNLSGKYILMNHIDLSDYSEWTAFGNYSSPFTGKLDGNGYSIIGLKAKSSLIGWAKDATIKNIGIVNCNIHQPEETASSGSAVGAFADNAISSSFVNCFASGAIKTSVQVGLLTIVSSCSVGGLVGISTNSSFVNCYNQANIHFTYDKISSAKIGGLVGDSHNTNFDSCYSTGNISSKNSSIFISGSSNVYRGGLVGSADNLTVFNHCYYENNFDFAVGKEQSNPFGTHSLSDSEMKSKEAFEGFDFEIIWKIYGDYPFLRSNKSFIKNELNLKYKESESISPNGNIEIIYWETSNSNIAIINELSSVESVGVGSASIYIKTNDGQSATITVNATYSFWQMILVYLLFGWIWY